MYTSNAAFMPAAIFEASCPPNPVNPIIFEASCLKAYETYHLRGKLPPEPNDPWSLGMRDKQPRPQLQMWRESREPVSHA